MNDKEFIELVSQLDHLRQMINTVWNAKYQSLDTKEIIINKFKDPVGFLYNEMMFLGIRHEATTQQFVDELNEDVNAWQAEIR